MGPAWVWDKSAAMKKFPHFFFPMTHEEEYIALPEDTKNELDKRAEAEYKVLMKGVRKYRMRYFSADKNYSYDP
ncbi:hypothetical protein KIPB_004657 [Kipferlia bialata]|uniref:Uncharacterized protein n=1 Tax=Kipferlia bialata TaxID=797122 RepID=A0A9K3GHL7_9EUKA|nr:hypothetical protein KIPB_004657 [Kipferlia bialata]|eukprot:g4657.t1